MQSKMIERWANTHSLKDQIWDSFISKNKKIDGESSRAASD